jgi:hypothetical protein
MAIAEYGRLGPDPFLSKYGFGQAKAFMLSFNGKKYDSKAIAGVAHGYQFPEIGPLVSGRFKGGKLPTQAGGHLFKLGFEIATLKRLETDWTLRECEITADAYFQCLRAKLSGERFNRRDSVNRAAERIPQRTFCEVDSKFQHIDAVLHEAELPRLGDAVASNIQTLLRLVVLDPLAARIAVFSKIVPKPSKNADGNHFVPIPAIDSRLLDSERDPSSLIATKIDLAKREAANREVDRSGEEWVVALEKGRLRDAGRGELAEKVRWVAHEAGDGLGYDIDSFEIDGSQLLIEVKATNQGETAPFFVSEKEWAVSEYRGSAYRIYRVFNLSDSPKVYVIPGPFSRTLNMRPTNYIALPNSNSR